MTDLTEWLREQIDRDRAEAEQGISDNSPSEVLAQCEAHTAILDLWRAGRNAFEAAEGTILAGATKVRLGAYEKTVRALGLAYQHRPGYRSEWRP